MKVGKAPKVRFTFSIIVGASFIRRSFIRLVGSLRSQRPLIATPDFGAPALRPDPTG